MVQSLGQASRGKGCSEDHLEMRKCAACVTLIVPAYDFIKL